MPLAEDFCFCCLNSTFQHRDRDVSLVRAALFESKVKIQERSKRFFKLGFKE